MPAPGAPIPAAPAWAPQPSGAPPGIVPSVLRLPAESVTLDGVIHLGGPTTAVMIAATTVNIGLRTGDEQWALLGAYGRWLNSLTGPVQIVISAQRVDLSAHAARIVDDRGRADQPGARRGRRRLRRLPARSRRPPGPAVAHRHRRHHRHRARRPGGRGPPPRRAHRRRAGRARCGDPGPRRGCRHRGAHRGDRPVPVPRREPSANADPSTRSRVAEGLHAVNRASCRRPP